MRKIPKNKIQLNPLAYNLMLLGESGIGKTTLIRDYLLELGLDLDNDEAVFLETNKEDGQGS